MKLYTIDNVKLINLKVIDSNNANVNVFENIDKYFAPKRIFTVVLKEFQEDEIKTIVDFINNSDRGII